MSSIILTTDRLILRTWQASDFEPMCEINQDPTAMEFFPSTQDRKQTSQLIEKIEQHYQQYGYTLYAVELKDSGGFIGFVGLLTPQFEAHFTPNTEIGWRLSAKHWGKGYAPEAAKAVLDFAFNQLNLPEVVSFTSKLNLRSIRVMEKIGLHHDANDDFDHPNLDANDPLAHHVLYRLKYSEYK